MNPIENSGTKEVLIFLHGFLSDRTVFGQQTAFFSRYFDCRALDLKGFGENADMEFPYSLSDYVSELFYYLETHRLERVHILAHSFGCRVAVKFTALYPERVSSLVLTGAAGLKPRRSFRYRVRALRYRIAKKIYKKKEKLEKFFSPDYRRLNPVMRESFKLVVNEYTEPYAARVAAKTLLIWGEKDTETPLYMGRRFEKLIANSRLFVMEKCGHFCFLEDPRLFNLVAREFLLEERT